MIESPFKLYADYSKIIRVIEDESSAESLQKDFNSATKWTKECPMKLINCSKYKLMHLGNRNVEFDYFIDDLCTEQRINLEMSKFERDL